MARMDTRGKGGYDRPPPSRNQMIVRTIHDVCESCTTPQYNTTRQPATRRRKCPSGQGGGCVLLVVKKMPHGEQPRNGVS